MGNHGTNKLNGLVQERRRRKRLSRRPSLFYQASTQGLKKSEPGEFPWLILISLDYLSDPVKVVSWPPLRRLTSAEQGKK
jgi:hypothetical protein